MVMLRFIITCALITQVATVGRPKRIALAREVEETRAVAANAEAIVATDTPVEPQRGGGRLQKKKTPRRGGGSRLPRCIKLGISKLIGF
jgi:hypothetical protein